MREVEAALVSSTISGLFRQACCSLRDDVRAALAEAHEREGHPPAKTMLGLLLRNADLAQRHDMPLCYDTGTPVVFAEMGAEVTIVGGLLRPAVEEGLKRVLLGAPFSRSSCEPPLHAEADASCTRAAVLHLEQVPGDRLRLVVMPKGAGGENASRMAMLPTGSTLDDVRTFVTETVAEAGPGACAPLVIGVGIGGSFERVGWLAKHALIRPVGRPSLLLEHARLEGEILEDVNALGIGPGGVGGQTTALAVHVAAEPCHGSSYPVAVNLQCNSVRVREATI